MKRIALIIVTIVFAGGASLAQQGFVRGKVTDRENGEGLYGATVVKRGTAHGVVADFDGNYSLALEPGLHTIAVTFISYRTQIIDNVEVKAGQATILDFIMDPEVAQLGEVVVSGAPLKDTETAILTFQRKSINLVDGVSNQEFRRTGDSDLASAMKRVTGVSVQGGKFIYVRGLGDRYTRTTLNGMTIPGLDPDRNDVQIDIFPTSVLENVIVYKTFSPNLPGDLTGGMVDVETKNFPDEKTTTLSIGLGFNPDMNLKPGFLTYPGGKTDWLGFDDGTRKLPFSEKIQIPAIQDNNAKLEQLTRGLHPTLSAHTKTSVLNTNLSITHGNQQSLKKFTLGYTALLSYQSRFEHYPDAEFGEYTKDDDHGDNSLFAEEVRKGPLSRHSVLWSGLLAASVRFDTHAFSASAFRIQNGVTEASERTSVNFDRTNATLYENILTYGQRSVTNFITSGTHHFGKLKAEWKNSFTLSRTYDPDFRATSISVSNETPSLNRGDGAGIGRFWRDLNEQNENFKADFTTPYGRANKFQFGASALYKDRQFQVLGYLLDATRRNDVPLDPDFFLKPENVWTPQHANGQFGVYLQGNYEAPNNYDAASRVFAGYVMTEMQVLPVLKATYGVRVEKADMYYTGENTAGRIFDNERTLNKLDLLPALSLIYSFDESRNLRASYGRTLARPSFREKSGATIFDPITKRFFNGNIDLQQTSIDNFDVRWEIFAGDGGLLSLSGFYKQFNGHIEMVTFDVAPSNIRPRNAGKSSVFGVELEIRKNLKFITPVLKNLSVSANLSLADSRMDTQSIVVNESGLTEFETRQNNAREGEIVKATRKMSGQAPYLLNAYLNYTNLKGTMNANLSYNVQGETLSIIGIGGIPDIYAQPFHSLNLNVFRNFGAEKNHRLTLGANNLLDATVKDQFSGHGGARAVYSIFKPGTTFTVSYGLNF